MARPCLAAALGVKEEQILFTASHNHSGPGTGGNFTSLLETVDAEYTEFLYTQVEAAACAAAQNVEPVRGTVHRGECALNVYRRVHTPDGIAMWPNYDMPADHHLTVVRLERADGTVKGVLVHYPCHANLANGNAVHPDYPGAPRCACWTRRSPAAWACSCRAAPQTCDLTVCWASGLYRRAMRVFRILRASSRLIARRCCKAKAPRWVRRSSSPAPPGAATAGSDGSGTVHGRGEKRR